MASEHLEQVYFVSWFRKNYDARIFAIPNGGNRDLCTAQKLKLEGVSPGVPDLFIPEMKLWIEMKTAKGTVSDVQKSWLEYLNRIKYKAVVCRGMEEAKTMVIATIQQEEDRIGQILNEVESDPANFPNRFKELEGDVRYLRFRIADLEDDIHIMKLRLEELEAR